MGMCSLMITQPSGTSANGSAIPRLYYKGSLESKQEKGEKWFKNLPLVMGSLAEEYGVKPSFL